MEGTARTVYVASAKYRDVDGDVPAKVEVYIDNVAYPMRLAGGKAADGTYRARLTLPPGEHSYYFYAQDARGADERFPRYGAKPGPFVGAKKPMNRQAMLSEGGIFFAAGTDGDVYTYTVHYRDRDDCLPPRAVKVIVDGICHSMKLHKGSENDGIYLYQASLPKGPHAYYFAAIDGNGDCVMHPAYGFLRGPDVMQPENAPPVLFDPNVEPPIGTSATGYTYTISYRDEDKDPAALACLYIDGARHKMKHVAGKSYSGLYTYRTRSYSGNLHDYYFYFEDGRGGTARHPEVGVFHGPVVTRY
jgi:hypothetical protein